MTVWTQEEDEELRRLWPDRLPREIAKLIGTRTHRAVSHRAEALALQKSPDYSGTRKFHPRFAFWRTWSQELAYAIGLIAADGNVYEGTSHHIMQMSLQEQDGYILNRLSMLGGGRTFPIPKKGQFGWVVSGISFVADLKTYGLIPRKSDRLTIPFIPREFQSHFVRGYFDGDGSAGEYRVERGTYVIWACCGNAAFLSGLREIICSHLVIESRRGLDPQAGNNLYNMPFTNRNDVLRIIEWLYRDAHLYLERKKEVCESIVASCLQMNMRFAGGATTV